MTVYRMYVRFDHGPGHRLLNASSTPKQALNAAELPRMRRRTDTGTRSKTRAGTEHGTSENAGYGLPQGSGSRSAREPGERRGRHRGWRRPRLWAAERASGGTDSVDSALHAVAADAELRVDRLPGIRRRPSRAPRGDPAPRRRSPTVPGHRLRPGASPRPGPSAVGVLGHRGPEGQPVGDVDEDPPRRGRRRPPAGQALRRR